MSNEIFKTLNLSPIDESSNVEIYDKSDSNAEQIDVDFTFARDNLYKLIEAGKNAFDDLTVIAEQSQHPKAYDALSNMLGQLLTATEKLMDLQRKRQMLNEKENSPNNITNNLYVGTSEELLKLLNNTKNESDKK